MAAGRLRRSGERGRAGGQHPSGSRAERRGDPGGRGRRCRLPLRPVPRRRGSRAPHGGRVLALLLPVSWTVAKAADEAPATEKKEKKSKKTKKADGTTEEKTETKTEKK